MSSRRIELSAGNTTVADLKWLIDKLSDDTVISVSPTSISISQSTSLPSTTPDVSKHSLMVEPVPGAANCDSTTYIATCTCGGLRVVCGTRHGANLTYDKHIRNITF